ncbi:MAG: Inositol 2-dehydrogenase/D-chiro-inositol 3-dehydrogenase [Bacillota bacterium]|jgi:myo-inositol 2-dehydrogenase/D-chiro-inositol 1-dehydrogenase|nr:Inositol 2-dehydrogenase/D-chiro-inositol 3-dehydrogenase [Bacillota bacterium]
MELNIGVIGTGGIGRDHIRRITEVVAGARVAAVTDIDAELAGTVANQYQTRFLPSAEELIQSPEVDAVVIASWDPTHAEYVHACIRESKQVLCEKPLASTADDCRRIIDAEIAQGKKLVQVGFMRRYDKDYLSMKAAIKQGNIGAPLMVHACHRNRTHIASHTNDMTITNSGVHEIDILRWMLEEEYVSAQVLTGKCNHYAAHGLQDPQLLLLQTESGILINVEVNMASGYGYDIQCEIVGETGTVRLPDPSALQLRSEGRHGFGILSEWSQRFVEAYDNEFKHWVSDVKRGKLTGPDSWDGYAACITAEALIRARNEGTAVPISIGTRPAFYH